MFVVQFLGVLDTLAEKSIDERDDVPWPSLLMMADFRDPALDLLAKTYEYDISVY